MLNNQVASTSVTAWFYPQARSYLFNVPGSPHNHPVTDGVIQSVAAARVVQHCKVQPKSDVRLVGCQGKGRVDVNGQLTGNDSTRTPLM